MRPLSKFPYPSDMTEDFSREIFYKAGFSNTEAIPEYAWAAVKLAYRLGYDKCGNVTGWD